MRARGSVGRRSARAALSTLVAVAACTAVPLTVALADTVGTPPTPVYTSAPGAPAGVYFVTQVADAGIARVTVSSSGAVTVESGFVGGLAGSGPDSIVFDSQGNLYASNIGAGTISKIDPQSGRVLAATVNTTPLTQPADLAYDPSSNELWGIEFSGQGSLAVFKVSIATGAVSSMNPDNLANTGGIAITDSGSRVFVSTHDGEISEVDKASGHVVRRAKVDGSPDGMSYDPSTGHLFSTQCGGVCELDTGGNSGAQLTLLRAHATANGDGIAADGRGRVAVISGTTLEVLNLADDKVTVIANDIPSADDVAPLSGAGAFGGAGCASLATCFDNNTRAGLAAVGAALVASIGLGGITLRRVEPVGGTGPQPHPAHAGAALAHAGASHAVAAHAAAAPLAGSGSLAAGGAGVDVAPAHGGGAHAAGTHSTVATPGAEGMASGGEVGFEAGHLQEETGDKLLEAVQLPHHHGPHPGVHGAPHTPRHVWQRPPGAAAEPGAVPPSADEGGLGMGRAPAGDDEDDRGGGVAP